jgi:hypothetical protein
LLVFAELPQTDLTILGVGEAGKPFRCKKIASQPITVNGKGKNETWDVNGNQELKARIVNFNTRLFFR